MLATEQIGPIFLQQSLKLLQPLEMLQYNQ